jgi:hypothetical protein
MSKQLLSLFLLFIAFLNAFGCSSNQGIRTANTSVSSPDASVFIAPDVVLLGISDASVWDESENTDASVLHLNTQNGEQIVPLQQDARAPFNGVLFNGPAVARVSVEFQAQQQRCLIERRRDANLLLARYDADIATLQLALRTQERTGQVLLSGRDQDISRLNRLLESQTRTNSGPHIAEGLIWAGGGLLVGVLVVGGIVVFANSRP